MLASISPLGERARGNRWGLTAGVYIGASVTAAALLGGLLGLGGHVAHGGSGPSLTSLMAVALVAGGAGVLDLVAPGRLLSPLRQVDEDWLSRYRGWVYGLGFGTQLGLGLVTIVTTATTYAWMLAAVLSSSVALGAGIGAVFGLARGAPLVMMAGVETPAQLRRVLERLSAWAGPGRVLAGTASVVVGAGTVAVAFGGYR